QDCTVTPTTTSTTASTSTNSTSTSPSTSTSMSTSTSTSTSTTTNSSTSSTSTTTTSTSSTTTTTCGPGLTPCPPDGCVDLQSDYEHCGACGIVCGTIIGGGEVCCNGRCSTVCTGGTTTTITPTTTTTTTLPCGGCPQCQTCVDGACVVVVDDVGCGGGHCCSGTCIDTTADNMNCGTCG